MCVFDPVQSELPKLFPVRVCAPLNLEGGLRVGLGCLSQSRDLLLFFRPTSSEASGG